MVSLSFSSHDVTPAWGGSLGVDVDGPTYSADEPHIGTSPDAERRNYAWDNDPSERHVHGSVRRCGQCAEGRGDRGSKRNPAGGADHRPWRQSEVTNAHARNPPPTRHTSPETANSNAVTRRAPRGGANALVQRRGHRGGPTGSSGGRQHQSQASQALQRLVVQLARPPSTFGSAAVCVWRWRPSRRWPPQRH